LGLAAQPLQVRPVLWETVATLLFCLQLHLAQVQVILLLLGAAEAELILELLARQAFLVAMVVAVLSLATGV
jgi:hypothetical protein